MCKLNSESDRGTEPAKHDGWWGRTVMEAHGGDAVSLAVLLQAQLLFVQVHRGGIDSCALQVQTDPLTPEPPEHSTER